jgi:hypothetical protein
VKVAAFADHVCDCIWCCLVFDTLSLPLTVLLPVPLTVLLSLPLTVLLPHTLATVAVAVAVVTVAVAVAVGSGSGSGTDCAYTGKICEILYI